jgi:hypothetical protein
VATAYPDSRAMSLMVIIAGSFPSMPTGLFSKKASSGYTRILQHLWKDFNRKIHFSLEENGIAIHFLFKKFKKYLYSPIFSGFSGRLLTKEYK